MRWMTTAAEHVDHTVTHYFHASHAGGIETVDVEDLADVGSEELYGGLLQADCNQTSGSHAGSCYQDQTVRAT